MFSNTIYRKSLLFIADMLIITGAYYFSFLLRLSEPEFLFYEPSLLESLPWLLAIRFLCGILIRQYTWAFRLASLSEAVSLVKAAIAGTLIFIVLCHYGRVDAIPPPRTVFAMEFGLSLMGFGFIRFFPRYIHQVYLSRYTRLASNGETHLRTLIYGAGHTGELILRDLLRTKIYPYKVVGFIDDDPIKWNSSIHGVRVFGSLDDLNSLIARHEIDKVLVAAPNIDGARMRRIVDICSHQHIRFKLVPPYANLLAKGDAAPITLKDVQLEDLLDRSPVTFDHTRMAEFFVGKTVLVTGAAGSIGSEICRQVAEQGARTLVAMDLNENDLYFLQLDMKDSYPGVKTYVEMGSIRDQERVNDLFAKYRPHLVFHAAAHKHVPLMENCPAEALKNNVLGTYHVVEAAHRYKAERFVLISTDKAVRPTNVMGATKRLAEFIIHKKSRESDTRYMAVRFGNVLGSNGSLIPILSRQIARGGPITITHPRITRFFMTIPEAVGLVLVAAVQIDGNLCVLDMGEPLSIDRLARQMISLSGLIPDQDIKIVYTGLRPGEKMYEELFTEAEAHRPSSHPRIYLACFTESETSIEQILKEAEMAIACGKDQAVYDYLKTHVPGFTPDTSEAPLSTPISGDPAGKTA